MAIFLTSDSQTQDLNEMTIVTKYLNTQTFSCKFISQHFDGNSILQKMSQITILNLIRRSSS